MLRQQFSVIKVRDAPSRPSEETPLVEGVDEQYLPLCVLPESSSWNFEMAFSTSSSPAFWCGLSLLVLCFFGGGSEGYQINCTNLFFSCGDNAGTPNSICQALGFVPAPTETYNPRGKRSVEIGNLIGHRHPKNTRIWDMTQPEPEESLLLSHQPPTESSRTKRNARRISFFDECCDNKCGISTFRLYCENDPDWVMSATTPSTTASIYTC